jgi:hypothetical protein
MQIERCRGCGEYAASIQTVTDGYGCHFWHQKCLESHSRWLGARKEDMLPQRYIWWQDEIKLDIEILVVNRRKAENEQDSWI